MTSTPAPDTPADPQVKDLRFALKATLCVLTAIAACLSISIINVIPRSEMIFEDMLGDLKKLPQLTKTVIAWHKVGGGLVVGLFAAVGIVLPWGLKSLRTGAIVALASSVLLLLHAWACWTSMTLPMIEVIKGLSGGVP